MNDNRHFYLERKILFIIPEKGNNRRKKRGSKS